MINTIKCVVRPLCLTGNNDADYKETFQHFTLFPHLILVGMTLIKLMHGIIFDKIHTACGLMLSWLRLTLESPYPFVFPSFSKLFFLFISSIVLEAYPDASILGREKKITLLRC